MSHMKLLLTFLFHLTYICVVIYGNEGTDSQTEIQEYLRALNVYPGGPVIRLPLGSIRPYPQFRSPSPQFLPPPSDPLGANAFAKVSTNGQRFQRVWPGVNFEEPERSRNAWASSIASSSSSVLVKKLPNDAEKTAEEDVREIYYSSLRDIDDTEEDIDANKAINEADGGIFHDDDSGNQGGPEVENSSDDNNVVEPMARKASSDMTTSSLQTNIPIEAGKNFSDVYFVALVTGCSAAGIFGVISAGFCFYKLRKSSKASEDVDYPAYGVTGPSKDSNGSPNGDRKLAQSAQMYHYQHQKQQMIAVENAGSTKHASAFDNDSEEENEEGDYTVYECPGLAPTGEMEVKNPLFNDDSTPASPPILPSKSEDMQSNN